MYGALHPRLHYSHEVCCCTGSLGLRPCHPQKTLPHHSPPGFPHPDRPDSRLFIQSYQLAAHQGPISVPMGPPISKPLNKVPNNQPKLRACRAELQHPVLEGNGVCPPGPAPPKSLPTTAVTVSLMMSTGVISGKPRSPSSYTCRRVAILRPSLSPKFTAPLSGASHGAPGYGTFEPGAPPSPPSGRRLDTPCTLAACPLLAWYAFPPPRSPDAF